MDDEFGDDADFAAIANSLDRPAQASVTLSKPAVQQPKPQALPGRSGPSSIIVSTRQKGNPSLTYIKNVPWEYGDIQADYVLGATTCALFLSLKYHRLHPEYIYSRIRSLGHKYNLRVMLTMVDIQNHEEPLKELSKTSLVNNLTLILCWSAQEAGRYLELYKSYEHASPTSIRAHQATSYSEKLVEFVTVPRSVNKTDAVSLVSAFGSLRAAVNARPEEIGEIAGWGEKKVQRWCRTVREPFRMRKAAKRQADLSREQTSTSLFHEGSAGEEGEEEDLLRSSEVQTGNGSTARSTVLAGAPDANPMGKIPLLEPTVSDEGAASVPAKRAHKRQADDRSLYQGPDEDEEQALQATAPSDDSAGKQDNAALMSGKSRSLANKEQPLSEGVAAALARLRQG